MIKSIIITITFLSSFKAYSMGAKRPKEDCFNKVSNSQTMNLFNHYVPRGANGRSSALAFYIGRKNELKLIASKNHLNTQAVASIQKIVSAYTLIKSGVDLRDREKFSSDDLFFDSQGNRARLSNGKIVQVGNFVKLEQYLRTMLIQSSNGAANALARGSFSSIEHFMFQMNQNVDRLLDKHQSFFQNPSGLTDSSNRYRYMGTSRKQLSSAKDMARFIAYMMNDRDVLSKWGSSTLLKFGSTKAAGKTFVVRESLRGPCSDYYVAAAFFGESSSSQFQRFNEMWSKFRAFL